MPEIRLTDRIATSREAQATLTLPFETRQRSRFRATLDDGREVAVVLPRGDGPLRPGDLLGGPQAPVVRVEAAPEAVSTVHHPDPFGLTRCAYHLGNRHVPLEVGQGWLRYARDHVLDEMVLGLGLAVVHELAPFEPESGAYAGHVQGRGHHHGARHHAH